MPPAAPSRRTVTLSLSLNRDLSVYALAAGAARLGDFDIPKEGAPEDCQKEATWSL